MASDEQPNESKKIHRSSDYGVALHVWLSRKKHARIIAMLAKANLSGRSTAWVVRKSLSDFSMKYGKELSP